MNTANDNAASRNNWNNKITWFFFFLFLFLFSDGFSVQVAPVSLQASVSTVSEPGAATSLIVLFPFVLGFNVFSLSFQLIKAGTEREEH